MMNYLAYCNGLSSNLEIAERINKPLWKLRETIDKLRHEGVIKVVDQSPRSLSQ